MSLRGNGFRVSKTPYVSGTPLVYITPTTEALPINAILKQGSTMGGAVGLALNSTYVTPTHIGLAATTGGTSIAIPCIRITPDVEFIVPMSSSETVISTTNVGNHVEFSSSGTSVVASATGTFKISAVYNTSAALAQYVKGYFVGLKSTV